MQSISTLLINGNSRLIILPAAGLEWCGIGAECQWSMPLSLRENIALTWGRIHEGALGFFFFFFPCSNSQNLGAFIYSQAFFRGSKGPTAAVSFSFRRGSWCMVGLEFIICDVKYTLYQRSQLQSKSASQKVFHH